ncbi:MAG: AAA family ATPase, partial [Pseudanabaenales cyanobacterium]|nr:AAA family ATPase [Pseudanabaenales cyanobacterium]
MPRSAKHLLIGSTEAYSGKSAAILGLAFQLQEMGIDIAYGKPLGSAPSGTQTNLDEDVKFIAQTLKLPPERIRPTLFCLDEATVEKQLERENQIDYRQVLDYYHPSQGGNLVLLEGPGTLEEGALFKLSLPQLADVIDASVVLTARYHSLLVVDGLLAAKQ